MAQVQLFAYFREAVGKNEIDTQAGNIYELIDNLIKDYGKLRGLLFESAEPGSHILKADVMILVNGKNIEGLDSMKTKLKKSDIVSIFPPICGG